MFEVLNPMIVYRTIPSDTKLGSSAIVCFDRDGPNLKLNPDAIEKKEIIEMSETMSALETVSKIISNYRKTCLDNGTRQKENIFVIDELFDAAEKEFIQSSLSKEVIYEKQCYFYLEGFKIEKLSWALKEKNNDSSHKEKLEKSYRKFSRNIASGIIKAMAETDTSIEDISTRLGKDTSEVVSYKLNWLIEGRKFADSLDFISDVLLTMGCEMDWSISKKDD